MLKPGGGHALFVPRPNIGEVDVAEKDSCKPLPSERRQLLTELRFHLGPSGGDGAEADPDRRRLRVQHLDAGGVESNTPGGRVVEGDEAVDVKPCLARAVQSQGAVLAAGPHQRKPAAHVSATRRNPSRPPASR